MSPAPTAELFNIVVLYERTALLGPAMATYSHLRRELDEETASDLRIWRIDIAASAEFADEAEHDFEAAQVIIIGVEGNQLCPPAFRRWKDGKLPGAGGPHRAVIAIVDGADAPGPAGDTWNSVLRGGATQIHPEIFVCEPPDESDGRAEPVRAVGLSAADAPTAVED